MITFITSLTAISCMHTLLPLQGAVPEIMHAGTAIHSFVNDPCIFHPAILNWRAGPEKADGRRLAGECNMHRAGIIGNHQRCVSNDCDQLIDAGLPCQVQHLIRLYGAGYFFGIFPFSRASDQHDLPVRVTGDAQINKRCKSGGAPAPLDPQIGGIRGSSRYNPLPAETANLF